jgi:DNA-binding beta-propeller fold protein YncE
MKKTLQKLSFVTIIAGLLASCQSSTTPPSTLIIDTTVVSARDRALFVVNEGVNADGSLDVVIFHRVTTTHDSASVHDTTLRTDTIVHRDLLTKLGLGNDILINGNRAYVLDNASATIDVVDADSLRLIATIPFGFGNQPNKMALVGPNLLLVTQRAATNVALVDLTKNAIVDSILIGEPSFAVAVLGGSVYVTGGATSYAGPFQLHVVDVATRKLINTLPLTGSPEQAVADSASGQIIIGCSGDYVSVPPRLYFIAAGKDVFADSLIYGNGKSDNQIIPGAKSFMLDGANIFALIPSAHQLGAKIISGGKNYYKGFYDRASDELYLGISDFTSGTGKVDVYNASSGARKWTFPAGIAPAHFAFYH